MTTRQVLALALSAGMILLPACGSNSLPTSSLTGTTTNKFAFQPIQHVVVIFGENVSFDHYFGVYPNAVNPPGEPLFTAAEGTPAVAGYTTALLTANPNSTNTADGAGASNPFRLDMYDALTASQNHGYTPEENAFDKGAMDAFPEFTGKAGGVPTGSPAPTGTTGLVMGYYDGNTVTGLWNYAQQYAINDHSFDTTFGPSSPGAVNLISGQTNGIVTNVPSSSAISDGAGGFTMIGDFDPSGDTCSSTTTNASMTGKNIGDLLNAAGISWGWFEGGFDLATVNTNESTGKQTTGCARASSGRAVSNITDYVPHHEPFQYYATTANPTHARPTSIQTIGKQGDAGNHNYDIADWFDAVAAGNFPTVSYLKAPAYQDGHPGNSDPLDEQAFVVNVVNFLQQQPDWINTVVIVAYDDSDGWYDHFVSPTNNPSFTSADTLSGVNACHSGTPAAGVTAPSVQGRCSFGPRTPLQVISPWAKSNYVDHTVTDQTSILRFIEDTFLNGERIGHGSFDATAGSLDNMFDFSFFFPRNTGTYFLDPTTGEVINN